MDGALGRAYRCIHFFIEAFRSRIPMTDVPTRHPIPRAEPPSSHASTRGFFLSPSRINSRVGFSDVGSPFVPKDRLKGMKRDGKGVKGIG